MINLDGFVKMFKTLYLLVIIAAVIWAFLPFVLAAIYAPWVMWFGIMTIPSAAIIIVIITIQKKILK